MPTWQNLEEKIAATGKKKPTNGQSTQILGKCTDIFLGSDTVEIIVKDQGISTTN